jgi:hypothetical protein
MRLAVALCLAATLAVAALQAIAAPSSAKPFELVLNGTHQAHPPTPQITIGWRHVGTFTATPPFCASGTAADVTLDSSDGSPDSRLYTCDDGSGTLTLSHEMFPEHAPPYTDAWSILGGTGQYAGLRGKGTYRGELVSGSNAEPLSVVFRSTISGLVDYDSVAPTVAVSAKATKLLRPASTYSLRLALALRDNEPGNAVTYTVAVEPGGGGLYLVQRKGSTNAGKVAMTLRIKPNASVRALLINVRAEDPVGNSRLATRRLKLPR